MTTARNDITGDVLRTRTLTTAYSDGYDRIFGKKMQLQADIAEAKELTWEEYNDLVEDAEEAHRVA